MEKEFELCGRIWRVAELSWVELSWSFVFRVSSSTSSSGLCSVEVFLERENRERRGEREWSVAADVKIAFDLIEFVCFSLFSLSLFPFFRFLFPLSFGHTRVQPYSSSISLCFAHEPCVAVHLPHHLNHPSSYSMIKQFYFYSVFNATLFKVFCLQKQFFSFLFDKGLFLYKNFIIDKI